MDDIGISATIIETLKREGPLSSNVLREKVIGNKEKGVTGRVSISPNSYYKILKRLIRDGEVIRHPVDWEDKKGVWYCVPSDKEKMFEKKYGKTNEAHEQFSETPIEARVSHTREIKDKVIKPWLKQLPKIFWDGPWHMVDKMREVPFRKDDREDFRRLDVEDEILFTDFKENHVTFSPNPFDCLEKFKKKTDKFWKARANLRAKINKLVEEEMGLPVISWDAKRDEPSKSHESGQYVDTVSFELNWLLYYAILKNPLSESSIDISSLDKFYYEIILDGSPDNVSVMVEIPDGTNFYQYRFDDRGVVWVDCKHKEPDKVKSEMDKKIKDLLETVKKPKYTNMGKQIVDLLSELEDIRKEMEGSLEKHLRKEILDGECPYSTYR